VTAGPSPSGHRAPAGDGAGVRAPEGDAGVGWHALGTDEVVRRLGTSEQAGLTSAEAGQRLARHGPNQLTEKPRPTILELLVEQLRSFVVGLLIVAAVVSAVVGEWIDAAAILAIVLLNAILGLVQEARAEEALAALKRMAAPEAHAVRDGRRVDVPAGALVPGDLVLLEAGNYVPADVRLLEAVNLQLDEAPLTGESVPVEKAAAERVDAAAALGDRRNSAFMGTVVTYGRGRGVVVATGMRTQLGTIAGMLEEVEEGATPLQQRLDQLGRMLGWGALVVCALVLLVGVARAAVVGTVSTTHVAQLFMVAISLAIAAVPEGLPAVVTISLALGMREMVRRHALVRRLAAVETLGSATVICSDKTGTLTQNAMTVTRLWADGATIEVTGGGLATEGEFRAGGRRIDLAAYPAVTTALWVGTLNNDAQVERLDGATAGAGVRVVGDPTEGALLVAAAKAGLLDGNLEATYPRVREIPFDAVRKRMVTIHRITRVVPEDSSPIRDPQHAAWHAVVVKGAADVVLTLCSRYQDATDRPVALDDGARRRVLEANDAMTRDALRVLGLAYRLLPAVPDAMTGDEIERDLVFAGLVGMIDPPRAEVRPALATARRAGIRTIMITGDYANTARAVAADLDLLTAGHRVVAGAELDAMDDATLAREIGHTDVFARVSPEHKVRIVHALRAGGDVVAMTGDGVNDAPAIKLADIGVAMGVTGTDVARETADIVLTDDNYASIVAAIEQGRVIYANIRKFVYYLLSCNLAEICIIFLSTLFTGTSPLTPLQILGLNLLTDGAPALALGTERGDPDTMARPPRPPAEPIVNRAMRAGIVLQTAAITAVTLAAYWLGSTDPVHAGAAGTMAFVTLSLSEVLRAYTARSESRPLLRMGVFGNRWMNLAALSSLAVILAVVYVPLLRVPFDTEPLAWSQWVLILPLLVVPSAVAEIAKLRFGRRVGTPGAP
jgi:Ca2+-transporting ATPase